MQLMEKDAYAFGDDWEDGGPDAPPSKSEVKRRLLGLQKLGKRLTELPPDTLAKLPIPAEAAEAVAEYQRIKTFKARRRQERLIGRLLRDVDPAAVEAAMDDAAGKSAASVSLMHRCEALRESLIASDEPLTALARECPELDIQQLRQAVRRARKEAAGAEGEKADPRPARLVYRLLHEALSKAPQDKETEDKEQ